MVADGKACGNRPRVVELDLGARDGGCENATVTDVQQPNNDFEVAVRESCLTHSADLLEVAEKAHESGKPNIAFHLAVLALEELGKLFLHRISRTQRAYFDDDRTLFARSATDHVAKLFWALWGTKISGRMNDREAFETTRRTASSVHFQRIAGLYVTIDGSTVTVPRDEVGAEETGVLLDLARSLLEEERATEYVQPTDEGRAAIMWLVSAAELEETRRLLYSRLSMEKLRAVEHVSEWISWLKETVAREEEEIHRLMIVELSRAQPTEGGKERFFAQTELLSATHSVRPKALIEWNERSKIIKLRPVKGEKSNLRVEFILFDDVRVDRVHIVLANLLHRLLVALNISSGGLFWPYLPEQSFPIFTRGRDQEHDRDLDLRAQLYSPFRLIDDQRNRRVLTLDGDRAHRTIVFVPAARCADVPSGVLGGSSCAREVGSALWDGTAGVPTVQKSLWDAR